jgi:imidazolonepropionase-like amidohydrolase
MNPHLSFIGILATLIALLPSTARLETIAITNARLLTMGPAGDVASGTLVMRDQTIVAAGTDVQPPAGARIIDARGGVVTPGLIAANTALALLEVNSVEETDDTRTHSRTVSAALDVQYALNPDSTLLPITRMGGVTRAIVVPDYDERAADRDLQFAGQAAMISLGASADILVRPKIGMVIELGESGAQRVGGSRAAQLVQLRELLDGVRFFDENRKAYDRGELRDLGLSRADLDALVPVIEGRMPLMVGVHRASDIRQALQLAREYKLRIILSGAAEGWRVAKEIAAAKVPVLLNPTFNLPSRYETLGATLQNAALLQAAGVEIAIVGNDPGHRVRDMRYNAGVAVSRGLPYLAAIEAITLAPARIFGVADQVGSLEAGKQADVVIWSGDPLEPLTQPVAVFIRGEQQPMRSRSLDLRDRYNVKPRGDTPSS